MNYLGFILQGGAFAALDLYLSGCTGNQVTAAVAGFGANFLIWILDLLQDQVGTEPISEVLKFLSLYSRNEPFLMGQLSWAGIVYEVSFAAVFLAMTVYHLNRRRTS